MQAATRTSVASLKMTGRASAQRQGRGAGSRPDLREPIRLLARRYLADPPHRARHVAGIEENQEAIVAESGQADPTQTVPGFVDGDRITGVYLPPVGLPDDSAAAHDTDLGKTDTQASANNAASTEPRSGSESTSSNHSVKPRTSPTPVLAWSSRGRERSRKSSWLSLQVRRGWAMVANELADHPAAGRLDAQPDRRQPLGVFEMSDTVFGRWHTAASNGGGVELTATEDWPLWELAGDGLAKADAKYGR